MEKQKAWLTLLSEVNRRVISHLTTSEKAEIEWPPDQTALKRPHFEIMFSKLEEHFVSTSAKGYLPGVETIERCFKKPEGKRDVKTKNALAYYVCGGTWKEYSERYWQDQPARMELSLIKSRVHMEFQGRIRDLQKNLPHTITDKGFTLDDPQIKRFIYLYFFLVFDEFHVCKVISPDELSVLWDEFYSKALLHALERKVFQEELKRILTEEDDYVFFGLKRDFISEINRLYRLRHSTDFFAPSSGNNI